MPSYTISYTWEITKVVEPPSVDVLEGDVAVVTYTVEVAGTANPLNFQVNGTVYITNPVLIPAHGGYQ